jgi:hypothetical protein
VEAKEACMADPDNGSRFGRLDPLLRDAIALAVVTLSLVILGSAVWSDKAKMDDHLRLILPMIGTWVGVVLAFYFGKENLETATRSLTAIAKASTGDDRLQSISVKDKMIPRASMFFKSLPLAQVKLSDTLEEMTKAHKGERLPILGSAGEPAFVVHRSMIDKYLATTALNVTPAPSLKTLTLEDLFRDAEAQKIAASFQTLKDSGTLADAKRLIVADDSCQDVFITQDGTRTTPVIGWITNVIIEENARV